MKRFKDLQVRDTICCFTPELTLYSMELISIENNDTFTFKSSNRVFKHKVKFVQSALEKSFIIVGYFDNKTSILGTDIRIKPFVEFLIDNPSNLKQEIIRRYVEKML